MNSTIIIALDFQKEKDALLFVEKLDPQACKLKVGLEMFTAFGQPFIHQLMSQGFDIFLDLKFHDIPNTVAAACRKVAEMNLWMTNVHALGGLKMMQAAQQAIQEVGSSTQLIAVTILTSHHQDDLPLFGIEHPIPEQVTRLALLTQQAGLDGVVCSAREVQLLKQSSLGADFVFVTPGIRPKWSVTGDQQRIMTPSEAQSIGAQHLVIGRPITQAEEPMVALQRIQAELST